VRCARGQASANSDRQTRQSDSTVVAAGSEGIPRQTPSCDHAVTSLRNTADLLGKAYLGPLGASCRAERSK
jgi:hypothetical protein